MLIIKRLTKTMANLISSNATDYQDFLAGTFQRFLIAQKASEKTRVNYIGDLKQFLNWLMNSAHTIHKPLSSHLDLLKLASNDLVENYKRSMLLDHVPVATLNRRLSALRMFFRCVMSQGWLNENPMEFIANIPKEQTLDFNDLLTRIDHYVQSEYIHHSQNQKTERATLVEFINWLKETTVTI